MMRASEARGVRVHVLADSGAVAACAAGIVGRACARAVETRGVFSIALSGGRTPVSLFRRLRNPKPGDVAVDWPRVQVFWSDERCVPPDHPDSNFGLAWRELFSTLSRQPALFRMRGEDAPEAAAAAYEQVVRARVAPRGGETGGLPCLDCVLLGMGGDGHTASLFPGSPALDERLALAAAGPAGASGSSHTRLTLTLPLINAARLCLLMVCGAEKSAVLHRALEVFSEPLLPVQRVRPCPGRLVALVDTAAWRGGA